MTISLILLAALAGAVVGYRSPELAFRIVALEIPHWRVFYAVSTSLASAATAWSLGWNTIVIAWLIIVLVGAVLSFIDLKHHRLPNKLVFPLYPIVAIALLIPAFQAGTFSMYIRALIAMVVLFGAYFLLALIYPKGMGMGDVNLAGVLGLGLGYLGWDYVFVGFMAAFILSSVVSIAFIIARKMTFKSAIAFGPFMILGAVATLVYAHIMKG